MFDNKRRSALDLLKESRNLLQGARKAVINRNTSRKNTIKKDLVKKVSQLEKLISTIDSEFKKEFLKLYKVGKELNIDIPSGSSNANNTNKLVYHWNMVQGGGVFGGLDFKKGHKMPKVSVMDPILKELARLVTNSEKKRANNKKAQNEAEAARKAEKNRENAESRNKLEREKELSELNRLSGKLNGYQRRLQNNGGVEMTNLNPRLTPNQRKNVYSKFSQVVTVGPAVNNLKARGITNANISAFKSKTATDRQLASIARAMKYNLK